MNMPRQRSLNKAALSSWRYNSVDRDRKSAALPLSAKQAGIVGLTSPHGGIEFVEFREEIKGIYLTS
jgi:hypothetical protein